MPHVVCRTRWRHLIDPGPVSDYFPEVSQHVPACNEPPEMVKESLFALSRIDYPNFEVIMADDNTRDESTPDNPEPTGCPYQMLIIHPTGLRSCGFNPLRCSHGFRAGKIR